MRLVATGVKVPKMPAFPSLGPAAKERALAAPEVCGEGCPAPKEIPQSPSMTMVLLLESRSLPSKRPVTPSNASVLFPKYEVFCCDQNGPPARREEGAYLNRYVTDEQRSRRPIFIATLWAGASWLFFRVARSTRMTRIWALRSRLEKQPTDLRQNTSYFGDRTLAGRNV